MTQSQLVINTGTGLVGTTTHCGTMTCKATTYTGLNDCDINPRSDFWFDESWVMGSLHITFKTEYQSKLKFENI